MARQMKDSGVEWIGEIPEGWVCCKQKHAIELINGRAYKDDEFLPEAKYRVLRVGNLFTNSKWYYSDMELEADKYCECGDLIYAWSASYGPHIWDGEKVIYHYHIWKTVLSDFLDKKFAYYYLLALSESIAIESHGSAMQHITMERMNDSYIAYPVLSEQRRIAAFLDRRCAEIDAVIERTKATIEEYKKLKQAVITEAVTKGVRGERKMKDSGIEWVKEIPVEWNSIHPKALFSQRKDKARAGQRQLTASQQHGIIYQDEYMELTGAKVVTVEKDFDILKQVEAGDFVISMRSFQGGLEYSNLSGSISSAYVMLIPNHALVYPRFFRWLLKSSVYINALQSTSNMVRDGQAMRYSNFTQVRLYTVPVDEQEEIAYYLDEKCASIDTLIAKKTSLLTELETYKKSLIYEYVTGKKEVPACP